MTKMCRDCGTPILESPQHLTGYRHTSSLQWDHKAVPAEDAVLETRPPEKPNIVPEPSTEGTQPTETQKERAAFARMNRAAWPNNSAEPSVPAPAAQVDEGKCGSCGYALPDHWAGCLYRVAAVAQTELPPIPQAGLKIPETVFSNDDFEPRSTKPFWQLQGELASRERQLRQALEQIATLKQVAFNQKYDDASKFTLEKELSEAREAELKAEIDRVREEFAAWTKGSTDKMEALERSHKALLESAGRFIAYWESDFIKVTCADGRTLAELTGRMAADLAAAEKL